MTNESETLPYPGIRDVRGTGESRQNGNSHMADNGNGNRTLYHVCKIRRMIVKQNMSVVEIKSAIGCCSPRMATPNSFTYLFRFTAFSDNKQVKLAYCWCNVVNLIYRSFGKTFLGLHYVTTIRNGSIGRK